MEKNIYGYARVSTKEQKEDRQIEALKEYGVLEKDIFVDKKSGKDFDRKEYQLLKRLLERTDNNILVIKSIATISSRCLYFIYFSYFLDFLLK